MRFPRLAFLVVFPLFAQFASSQQNATTVPHDPQAVAVIQKAIVATAPTAPSDSTATGAVTIVAGSETGQGTVSILTRGTNQTSIQFQTDLDCGQAAAIRNIESLRGRREQERSNRVVADCTRRIVSARSVGKRRKKILTGKREKIPKEMLEPLKMAQMAETSFFKT